MIAPAPATLDERALEELYTRLERRLYNVVFRWLWHEEEALDVVQEAFLRLWDMRERVRLESVEPLLFRIAVNLAANRRRSRRLWSFVGLDGLARGQEQERQLERSERDRRVREALEALPERHRRVVVLTELSGLSYAEVARILEIPEGTVGSRRNKALALLKERLGAWFHEVGGRDEEAA